MTNADGTAFDVAHAGVVIGSVRWPLIGRHNACNALAAIAAAAHVGVDPAGACAALASFRNVRRRLEVHGRIGGITVYDDFAHHPTAIRATLEALRAHVGKQRIIAVLDPASSTMRSGVHKDTLGDALSAADAAWIYRSPSVEWDVAVLEQTPDVDVRVSDDIDSLIAAVGAQAIGPDHVVIMSNSGFGGIHKRLMDALAEHQP